MGNVSHRSRQLAASFRLHNGSLGNVAAPPLRHVHAAQHVVPITMTTRMPKHNNATHASMSALHCTAPLPHMFSAAAVPPHCHVSFQPQCATMTHSSARSVEFTASAAANLLHPSAPMWLVTCLHVATTATG